MRVAGCIFVFGTAWSKDRYCRNCMAILPVIVKDYKDHCKKCGKCFDE